MRLTPTERDRLLINSAAELARQARARGLRLSAPEAIALISDEVQWAARGGASYEEAKAAGAAAVRGHDVLEGVADILDEIRVEAMFDEGTRMVVVRRPLAGQGVVGEVRVVDVEAPATEEHRVRVDVTNTSHKVVRVSSHYPFHLVNARLHFDRDAARGYRLDLPAGRFMRWGPGQRRSVTLVATSHPVAD